MDIEAMIDDFITFFIAGIYQLYHWLFSFLGLYKAKSFPLIQGQETSATSLAFCFQELCSNPECYEK